MCGGGGLCGQRALTHMCVGGEPGEGVSSENLKSCYQGNNPGKIQEYAHQLHIQLYNSWATIQGYFPQFNLHFVPFSVLAFACWFRWLV